MTVKNYTTLVKAVSMLEGGKVNLPVAQIKEVLACLSDLIEAGYPVSDILTKNGKKRFDKGLSKLATL